MLWNEALSNHNRHFWQTRFYEFNVYSNEKRFEKLRYMHRNPSETRLGPFSGTLGLEQLSSIYMDNRVR